ncbi:sporulation related protein [Lutibacter oceani]|uniref:Sporulation related protein n=1 Tax=Lutibacter oceani TaxID=1853311 RepID=A0A3D9RUE9_9FLAO|nr:SPOR domain-containing protein [Lutibacter oceani]REE80726.1 sporulation related protein [Lutibacter oceani]
MKLTSKKRYLNFLLIFVLFAGTLFAQSENEKIDNLITQKRSFNKHNKNTIVYKIQLYNGSESQAYKIKSNFQSSFPEYKTKIIYKSPEWKTQVGDFETRLEADKVLLIIKEEFSGAIVLEENI